MMFQLTLRQRGISDQAVLKAMGDVPRELFVTSLDRGYAYRDTPLGIACGQTISQPFVVAYMTEQLDLEPGHRVLEIGTGSGYQAAILGEVAGEVYTIEIIPELGRRAAALLERLGYENIHTRIGDGFDVPETLGTFDRIMVTAAMEEIPEALLGRLEPNGVLIAPVGPMNDRQVLVRVVRTADGFNRQELVAVRFVPALQGIAREL